jgi:S1-C subfamily serine protease
MSREAKVFQSVDHIGSNAGEVSKDVVVDTALPLGMTLVNDVALGQVIVDVAATGQAGASGQICSGDVLTHINGVAVPGEMALQTIGKMLKENPTATLTIKEDGPYHFFPVPLFCLPSGGGDACREHLVLLRVGVIVVCILDGLPGFI